MYKNVQSKFEVCVGSQNFLVMVSWDCLPKVGLSNSSGRGRAAGDQFRERENTERQYTKLAVASTSGRQSRTMRHENIEKKNIRRSSRNSYLWYTASRRDFGRSRLEFAQRARSERSKKSYVVTEWSSGSRLEVQAPPPARRLPRPQAPTGRRPRSRNHE